MSAALLSTQERVGHAASLVGGAGRERLYVFGGFVRKLGYMFDVHVLDIATVQWQQLPVGGTVPDGRINHTMCTRTRGAAAVSPWTACTCVAAATDLPCQSQSRKDPHLRACQARPLHHSCGARPTLGDRSATNVRYSLSSTAAPSAAWFV